jgi:hypothetical protein
MACCCGFTDAVDVQFTQKIAGDEIIFWLDRQAGARRA